MTKLFSIKSLACAGAAAFALTLAAAPQASAEAPAPLKLTPTVDYSTGILTVKGEGGVVVNADTNKMVDKYVVETADGKGIYLGTGKNASKIKYALTTDAAAADDVFSSTTDDKKFLHFDISNLIGKETTVAVALDQEGTTASASVTLVAAPKLKAKLDGDDIKINVDGSDISTGLADEKFTGYTYEYKIGTYGKWEAAKYKNSGTPTLDTAETNEDIYLKNAIKAAKNFGTTIYVRVAKSDKTKKDDSAKYQTSPWSKEAKVKVSAKAKAPKINIKTAELTKPFEWKMGSKVEYRIEAKIGSSNTSKTSAWTTGGDKSDWTKIITTAAGTAANDKKDADLKSGSADASNKMVAADANALVNGDAIATDVKIQLRTAATEKKDASKISFIELKASENSPTIDEIKVVAVQSSKKGATASAAAISPATIPTGYVAQYSVDGGKKWKKLTGEVRLEADKLNNKTVDIRLVGSDKKKLVLPSAVTTVTIPTNGTTGSTSLSKDARQAAQLSAVMYQKKDNAWEKKEDKIYSTKDIETDLTSIN